MLSPDTLVILAVHGLSAVAILARTSARVDANTKRIDRAEEKVDQHEGEIGVLYGHAGLTR